MSDVTRILDALQQGNPQAAEELLPLVYEELRRLAGHQCTVTALAFSPDGQTLASGSQDRTARLWNLAERREELRFADSDGGFARLALSPDGRTLAMSGGGGAGRVIRLVDVFSVWDTQRLAEGGRRPLPFTKTTAAAVAPGGRLAAFGSRSGEVRLWDGGTGQARFFAQPGTNSIHRLAFSLDGRHLAAADNAKLLSQMGSDNVCG